MIYKGKKLKNISFPVGGIGTGSIGIAGNGRFIDWEIFNRPDKTSVNGFTHFAVKAEYGGKTAVKVLHGDTTDNLMGPHSDKFHTGIGYGPLKESMAGFPHFSSVAFKGEFPVAELTFTDKEFPLKVKLTAFNPFIPHNDFDSSLPSAFFETEVCNTSDEEVRCTLAFSLRNPSKQSRNTAFTGEANGIFCGCGLADDDLNYKDLCIATDHTDVSYTRYWYRGGWCDPQTIYWRDFCERERQEDRTYDEAGNFDHCSLFAYVELLPQEKKKVKFVLAWNAPNNYNYWEPLLDENGKDVSWKNYYATCFSSSKETAQYSLKHFDELREKTLKFKNALFSSSMPKAFIDAVSANLATLQTATVLRLEDGAFYGWEGLMEKAGSCEGTCQHVWNYAYALPFLFPKLERSLRETVYKYNMLPSGETAFRTLLPIGRKYGTRFRACVDGQTGEVIKAYREWKISGDDGWLKSNWDSISKMLEYAWSDENEDCWDPDADGVLDGRQHHTLDMELFGANSWLEGMYLLALRCGSLMAERVGDREKAEKYLKMFERGRKWTDENLFNGEYFYHKVDLTDKSVVDKFGCADYYWNDEKGEIKYQIGDGCEIDQMLADWHANILHVDGVFDKDKKAVALGNIVKNNFKKSMRGFANMWRLFTVDDESGVVICSYPNGAKKPAIPVPYCEETMAGFEYALAGLLISEGYYEKGAEIVQAIRARYNGENRNPWNEMECGSNYARSMAAYALLPIVSGFDFDLPNGRIGFQPLAKGDCRYLWSAGNSWGEVFVSDKKCKLCVYGEPLTLESFSVKASAPKKVLVDKKAVEFNFDGKNINFGKREITDVLEIEY